MPPFAAAMTSWLATPMQMSHFEAYSAECAQRSPADAVLHSYL